MGFVHGVGKRWTGQKEHELEHLLTDMMKKMRESKLGKYMRANAIKYNATTTQDYISVEFASPSNCVETLIPMFAEMFTSDFVDPNRVETEKRIILQERAILSDTVMNSDINIFDYLYNKSTIGTLQLVGSKKQIMGVTPKQLLNLKKKIFIVENFRAGIVTDLPKENVVKLLKKELIDKVPSNPKNQATSAKRTYNFGNYLIVHNDDYTESFNINLIYKAKGSYVKNELQAFFEDWYLNGFYGRLEVELREKNQLTYTSSIYDRQEKDARFKVIDITTTPRNAHKCVVAVAKMLNDMVTKGISQEEFEDFQSYILANRARHAVVKIRSAHNLFEACVEGKRPFVKGFFKKCLALTIEDINKLLYDMYANTKFALGYKGNIDLANYAAIMEHPYNVMTHEAIAKIDEPLLTQDEVAFMISPKKQLKANVREAIKEYTTITPPKPFTGKPKLNKKQPVLKAYIQELKTKQLQQDVSDMLDETNIPFIARDINAPVLNNQSSAHAIQEYLAGLQPKQEQPATDKQDVEMIMV